MHDDKNVAKRRYDFFQPAAVNTNAFLKPWNSRLQPIWPYQGRRYNLILGQL